MKPGQLLSLLGGAATRKQLRAYGMSDRQIEAAVAGGSVVRVRQGVYALALADELSVARVAWRCEPTCLTAARRIGLPLSSPDQRLHVAVGPQRSSARPNAWPPHPVVVHMAQAFGGSPVMSAADVIDSTARCASPLEQLEMVDAALNRALMSEADLASFRYTSLRTRRWLVRNCDGRSQSLLETRARLALAAAGLKVEPQVLIPDVGYVDLMIEGKVVVETDGRATHSLAAAFDTDRRRDRAALIAGFPVMRFGYGDVMGDIDVLVQQVMAAVRGRD